MHLRENKNKENFFFSNNKINKENTEFLKPIAVHIPKRNNNKHQLAAIKQKFIQDYKNSLNGINTQFDLDFLVGDCIGSGSTGAIFMATSSKNKGKKYALKFLMERKSKIKETFHKKAKNEIKLQYNLKNPNITQVYGYYTLNNDYCIVQDYEKMGDLLNFQKNILCGGQFNENLILLLTHDILSALKHLLDLKIAHLDIKIENILVDEFLNFKLSDFSISESYFGFKTFFLKNSGTGCYISPENYRKCQINIEDIVKVDLWSLGILLYTLVNNNQYPFNISGKEQNLDEIHLKIAKNPLIVENLNCSDELKDVLKRLLAKNIKDRISFHELLTHPFIKSSQELIEIKHKYGDNNKFMCDIVYNKVF